MNLEQIKSQLKENDKSQAETTAEVKRLSSLIEAQFLEQKRNRLDDLEALRELKKGGAGNTTNITNNAGDSSGGGFGLPGLGKFLIPGLAALAAELAGLDDFLKGLSLLPKLDSLKNFLKRLGNFFDKLKKIKLPKIPRIRFQDGKFPRIRFPELPRIQFLDNMGNKLKDIIDYKIRLPIIDFVDNLGKRLSAAKDGIPRARIKLPELPKFEFVSKAGDFVKGIQVELPKLPKIVIGDEAVSAVRGLKNILGVVGDGAGAAGKGILGFFKIAFDLLDPVLAPLKFVAKTILRPFTQILLSVIDFVQGFYEGFTTEEGTMKEKLLSGLEGGFLGVVKGITEGFDLIFLELPAMLADYVGAQGAAEFLRGLKITDFVDPIYAGIKGLVVFVGDQFMNMKDIIVGSFTLQLTRIINGVKIAFERLASFVSTIGDELYLMIAKNFRFSLPEVKVPGTFLTPEFTLIPPINVGIGDAQSISEAQARIDTRRARRDTTITGLEKEVADMMKAQQDRLAELQNAFQNQVISAVNNSTNTVNNTQNTVLNSNQMPSTLDEAIQF